LHNAFSIFAVMEMVIEDQIIKYTLFPIIAWIFLWLMDKLEHMFVEKYFKWTLRVEQPIDPLKISFKKLFKCVISLDLIKAKTPLKDISRSGLVKFVVAYFIGVCLVEFSSYGWLKIGRSYV
tara:strand:+ start:33 stop:398 length:366 start_codon:yes stop_codon:yes gene_type:complete